MAVITIPIGRGDLVEELLGDRYGSRTSSVIVAVTSAGIE